MAGVMDGAGRYTSHPAVLLLCILLAGVAPPLLAAERTFDAEGSDTAMGVGARYVALGGTGTANSDDLYAIYSNPAGLAEIDSLQMSVSRQVNANLLEVNFLGAAVPLPFAERFGVNAVVAASYIPRLHATSNGAFGEDDLESIFLRYLLPGLSGDFDGEISSKTKDYRLAIGMAPADSERWSVGLSLGYVDCGSYFCGVTASRPGVYQTVSTGATAWALNLGARYRPHERLTLGAAVSDLDTTLDVHTRTTDDSGTRDELFDAAFPRKYSLGAYWLPNDTLGLAASYEAMVGQYGTNEINMQVLRLGAEKRHARFMTRYGVIVPVKIEASGVPDIDLPFPVMPTLGAGWRGEQFEIDVALYAHPIMSYHKNGAYPAADITFTLHP